MEIFFDSLTDLSSKRRMTEVIQLSYLPRLRPPNEGRRASCISGGVRKPYHNLNEYCDSDPLAFK